MDGIGYIIVVVLCIAVAGIAAAMFAMKRSNKGNSQEVSLEHNDTIHETSNELAMANGGDVAMAMAEIQELIL